MNIRHSLNALVFSGIVFATCNALTAHAAGGDFDAATFNSTGNPAGLRRFVASGTQSEGAPMAITANGGIVIASSCYDSNTATTTICVNKLTASGGNDNTFATNGLAVISYGGVPNAIAQDAQGNLWIAAFCNGVGACLFKMSPSGGFYTNVGVSGRVAIANMADIQAIIMSPTGRMFIGGSCPQGVTNQPCMARLMPDGTMDTSFNGGAMKFFGNGTLRGGTIRRLQLQSDGALLAGGTCDIGTTVRANRMCFAWLDIAGSSNPYWTPITVPGSTESTLGGFALTTDNAVILSGTCAIGGTFRGCMARFQLAVGVDATFGSNGYIPAIALGQTDTTGYDLVQREDGSLIFIGQCVPSTTPFQRYGICLAAYNADGTQSNQFGGASTRLLDTEPAGATTSTQSWLKGTDALRTPDGKLLTGGSCYAATSNPGTCIARLQLENTIGARCSPDLDASSTNAATNDGLLLLRTMLGLSGNAVLSKALAPTANRLTWASVRDFAGLHCRIPVAP